MFLCIYLINSNIEKSCYNKKKKLFSIFIFLKCSLYDGKAEFSAAITPVKKHLFLLLSVLKTVVLLNIFLENVIYFIQDFLMNEMEI